MSATSLAILERIVPRCRRCPELREYCAEVGQTKRRAYADWAYWARPVPGFGDHDARIMIVGLAPAAHGANRTGRMFTGDRSGDFLYAGLHRVGLSNQPESRHREDGLHLTNTYIAAACRCAPPANKPTAQQLANCRTYLADELRLLQPAVTVCLGRIGFDALLKALSQRGTSLPRPKPKFGHGVEHQIDGLHVLGCYHVSQQNTFTGRLTEQMLDAVLQRAKHLAGRTG